MKQSDQLPFIYEYDEPQVRVFPEGESGLPHLDEQDDTVMPVEIEP